MDITNKKELELHNRNHVDISSFTKDQIKAYEELIGFINGSFDSKDYKRALLGAAGTGKTYLVKALIANCNLSYSTIGLAAPTHKACSVLESSIGLTKVHINTLASDFGLKPNFDANKFDINNPPFDQKGRIKVKDYMLYIIDEASMIPNKSKMGNTRGFKDFIESICVQNQCKIIYIGDPLQLPPVGESYSSAFHNIKKCELFEIVRQEKDNPITQLLQMLRYDIEHKTFTCLNYIAKNRYKFDDNNIKGYEVCDIETFKDKIYTNFNDPQLMTDVDYCKIVAYTNLHVSGWNKYVRYSTIIDSDKSIVTKNDLFLSNITITDIFNNRVITNSENYIVNDVVNYIHPKYGLKGFLVKFQAILGGKISQPLFVLDHSDVENVKQYITISDKLVELAKTANVKLRGERWKSYYEFKESCLLLIDITKNNKLLYARNIDYGFALTAHKSQGSTFDTVFVDVRDIVYDSKGVVWADIDGINRRLYVAISRAKNKVYLNF